MRTQRHRQHDPRAAIHSADSYDHQRIRPGRGSPSPRYTSLPNRLPSCDVYRARCRAASSSNRPKAQYAEVIRAVDEILAFYADDRTPNPQGILHPSKRSRPKLAFSNSFPVAMRTRLKVEFDDERIPSIAVGDEASFVSIGLSIDPKLSSDVDNFCPFDMPASA